MICQLKKLYVIRLNFGVLEEQEFLDQNPRYKSGKPCLYVGSTDCKPRPDFRSDTAFGWAHSILGRQEGVRQGTWGG